MADNKVYATSDKYMLGLNVWELSEDSTPKEHNIWIEYDRALTRFIIK